MENEVERFTLVSVCSKGDPKAKELIMSYRRHYSCVTRWNAKGGSSYNFEPGSNIPAVEITELDDLIMSQMNIWCPSHPYSSTHEERLEEILGPSYQEVLKQRQPGNIVKYDLLENLYLCAIMTRHLLANKAGLAPVIIS